MPVTLIHATPQYSWATIAAGVGAFLVMYGLLWLILRATISELAWSSREIAAAIRHRASSSARLSMSTFTRGSPRSPSVRGSTCSDTSARRRS
jgi:hypothetical protein